MERNRSITWPILDRVWQMLWSDFMHKWFKPRGSFMPGTNRALSVPLTYLAVWSLACMCCCLGLLVMAWQCMPALGALLPAKGNKAHAWACVKCLYLFRAPNSSPLKFCACARMRNTGKLSRTRTRACASHAHPYTNNRRHSAP